MATEAWATVTPGDILRNPTEREKRFTRVALVIKRGEEIGVMPPMDHRLREGRQIPPRCREKDLHLLQAKLHNEHTLNYLITGVDEPRG